MIKVIIKEITYSEGTYWKTVGNLMDSIFVIDIDNVEENKAWLDSDDVNTGYATLGKEISCKIAKIEYDAEDPDDFGDYESFLDDFSSDMCELREFFDEKVGEYELLVYYELFCAEGDSFPGVDYAELVPI